jgi:fibrillarin-like pre-rRNA processing protein
MHSKQIRPHVLEGVFTDGDDLYTRSLLGDSPEAGPTVGGDNGHAYRSFPPRRSKLAAMVKRRVRAWPFHTGSRVLYLGAGAGTTVSFMSDICPEGTVFAVEFAPDPFRGLVEVATDRPNVVPILADAREPATYRAHLGGPVDIVYQDVAQRDQWDILRRNADAHLAQGGHAVLLLKARSVDVASPADAVYAQVRAAVEASHYEMEDFVALDPYEREHAVFVLRRARGAAHVVPSAHSNRLTTREDGKDGGP